MLRIRDTQMAVFRSHTYRTWAERMLGEVLACWPRLAALPADTVLDRLVRCAAAADLLGLTSSAAWLRYANVALALGDDFARQPEAALILGSGLRVDRRLDQLVAWAGAKLRER